MEVSEGPGVMVASRLCNTVSPGWGLCLPRANDVLSNGGFLGRMAYELGLDMPNARPLPLDQLAAREILVSSSCFVIILPILTI